ncbi:MAG: hypothetical protein HFI49_03740 [Bacilli bacterium]|jgi:hypothetical protein|nr:hypothetical protein [Bacilli bacterium]
MIFANDIYIFIGDALLEDGYRSIIEVPINVIEKKINEFLRMKLNISDNSIDNSDLLRMLERFLEGQQNKDQMMAVFTFYLLWIITMHQGFEITWKIDDVEKPLLRASEFYPGKIDSLVTSKNIDYVGTFNFVLEEAKKLLNNENRGRI